jgi:copper chaperone NosL
MNNLLRRELLFLRRPLNVTSRIFMLAAAVVIVAATFLPLWRIHLVAPQYREGLSLQIYSYQLVGGNGGQDLVEINGLNHYIGMKPLTQADFVEMTWLPFAFGIFALLALRAAVLGRMISLVDLGVAFLYFGLFSLGNFYYRLYSYGHNLDPRAPMEIEPFTPVMIGTQKIANFVQTSLPQSGGWLMAVFPVLIVAAVWFSRKEEPVG